MDAYRLYSSDAPLRWELEARILSGQTDHEISLSMGIPAMVASIYERSFFDVRSRLTAGDFVLFSVVGYRPLQGFADKDLRGLWAYFGYAAGPKMLELVMAVSLGRLLPQWALEQAPSRADIDLMICSVKLTILASAGLLTPSKLRKLRILQAQMAELNQRSALRSAPSMDAGISLLAGIDRSDVSKPTSTPTPGPKNVDVVPTDSKLAEVA